MWSVVPLWANTTGLNRFSRISRRETNAIGTACGIRKVTAQKCKIYYGKRLARLSYICVLVIKLSIFIMSFSV